MEINLKNESIIFEPLELIFEEKLSTNVFADKNNKTLQETIEHNRYKKLSRKVNENYATFLSWKLGEFLLYLKGIGDNFYEEFLNKNGDLNYSRFYIDDEQLLNKKGLYAYTVNGEIKYIGRCRDNFKKRINNGYGKIHPKNCFIDGQSTNCHLNYLITKNKENIELYVYELENNDEIEKIEKDAILELQPIWNIALKK
ncbi:hypothetical protein [Virgibacillus doumboii]|uniref:hypothetical protein n=1 Tax=Virgibacillus doumboii TaxID=2697503 RepID=UPI0013E03427|nr:hypothetical protein [Virgibacillus doumboii]